MLKYGQRMLEEVNGNKIISLGYSPEKDYKIFNEKLRQERIKWVKDNIK